MEVDKVWGREEMYLEVAQGWLCRNGLLCILCLPMPMLINAEDKSHRTNSAPATQVALSILDVVLWIYIILPHGSVAGEIT